MTRLLLSILLICSLSITFGCAMKSATSLTTDTTLQESATKAASTEPTTQSDPLRADQGQIREETIIAAPATTMTTEPVAQQTKSIPTALQIVPFSYDQHLLSDEARDIIAANAAILKKSNKVNIQLTGHCDERGSDQYNISLGERRAEAVRAYLLDLGIDASRMETVSYGEEQPIDAGHDESAWVKNRRVEFILLP